MRIDVPIPSHPDWGRVTARRLFERARREPREHDGIVTAFRDGQVTLRLNRRVEGFTNAVEEIGYQGISAGDLVIHSMDGFAGAIGVSDSDGKASPVVHCYVPLGDADQRYYAYLLRVLAQRGFITSLAKGIRERSTAFDVETFRSLLLPHPSLAEQRAIADYLDAETARIDALIAKKQQLIHLLEERFLARVDDECSCDDILLRRVVARFVDYRGATPDKTDQGVPLLTATHVKGGAVNHSLEPVFVSEATYETWMRRGFPVRGDVLLTMEAPLGEVAQITEERVALAQRLMLLQVDPTRCVPEYLAFALRSRTMQDRLRAYATGSTALGIKADRLKGLPVPVPSLAWQAEVVTTLRHEEREKRHGVRLLSKQLDLLAEHRQALITAAVTGKFQVPGAV